MCKHVDLLAVGVLLLGVTLMAQVRKSAVIEYQSVRLIDFTTRHLQQLSLQPYIPQLCLSRD